MGDKIHFRHVKGKLRIFIFIIHCNTLAFASAIAVFSKFMKNSEEESFGFLHLNYTTKLERSFYACAALLITCFLLGIYGLIKHYSGWIVVTYSLAAFISGLIGISGGGVALYKTVHFASIKKILFLYMDHYDMGSEKFNQSDQIWNDLQTKYNCCGLDDYRDWQLASSGLTTLRVPSTCCKLVPELNITTIEEDCGQNFLPEHQNASIFLNSDGCLKPLLKNLNFNLYILCCLGFLAGVVLLCLGIFACYLILTKRA